MKRSTKLPNTHPGEILLEEVIEVHHLSIGEAADLLGITRPALSNIVNEKSSITPNMALRIKAVFGGTAEIWVRLQAAYDLRKAEQEFLANPPELVAVV